jgi:5-methylthioadenosine/S-adenosylhomocysteine deaminase
LNEGEEYGVPIELIENPQAALADARALIKEQNRPGGRVQVGLAPCMIWALDEAGLRATRAAADELGVLLTIHLSETLFEIDHSNRVYDRTDTDS